MGARQRVAVVDYGMGNLHSVAKALEHVGSGSIDVDVTDDPGRLSGADRVVFPGVGAIRDCIGALHRRGFADAIAKVVGQRPLLAICVGMQALLEHSEENDGVECLGLLPGTVHHFEHSTDQQGGRLKVPHMGWNRVAQVAAHPLWEGIADGERFYFVHSYYASTTQPELIAGACDYGGQFAAALMAERLFAVQFHPEKSDRAGLQLLKNFLSWDGSS